MRIGVLTSSRADYYIYTPLLEKLREDPVFDLNLLVFGTHLSEKFGYTLGEIKQDGYTIAREIMTLPADDSPEAISFSIGDTICKFSKVWEEEKFDVIIALGDRYEMFAAVASTIPFNLTIAHIHGGESTLGAIDNVFRHSISLFADIHFTCSSVYKRNLIRILGGPENIFNVGALSIDNLKKTKFLTIAEFNSRFKVDLSQPYILITFHPETVGFEKNEHYIDEIITALKQTDSYHFIVTMPNSDTENQVIRQKWIEFGAENERVHLFENLGKDGYLTCMRLCALMLGNSSSGFIEASFFPKAVVNIGDRQKGRILTPNIINCPAKTEEILQAIKKAENMFFNKPIRDYGNGNTASKIVSVLKTKYNSTASFS